MTYNEQQKSMWTMPTIALAGLAATSVAMTLLWTLQRRTHNAGVVDVGWAFSVGALALLAAALSSSGWSVRRLSIALVMATWSARLGVYLLRDRIIGKPEDGRYAELRRAWGRSADGRMFWFFQTQAVAALFFSLPALIASANPHPSLLPLERVALLLWLLAFTGELTADRQLEHFKSDAAHRGQTCRSGLWRYSRHPNYFFEWLMWVAYALFALPSPWGAAALACPAAMLYLLFRVTGIPATEAQALRSRGEDYRRYQQTTSAFFPWIPKL
jgi:steroid 5-alpha reductase family enzyme